MVLQIAGAGDTECKPLDIKKDSRRRSIVINNGDGGSLRICIGSRDGVFGADGHSWAVMEMEHSNKESLVKDKLYIIV